MPDGPNGELGVKAKEPYGERLLANAVLSNEGLMIHATVPLSFVWSVRRASFGVATDDPGPGVISNPGVSEGLP